MTVSCGEATIQLLAKYGVDTVFGIPGVHTLDFCTGLGEGSPIKHIQVRNEQGAGFMAEGGFHADGAPGILVATLGPGVANAVNVVANAFLDRVPLIFLTGCVDECEALTYTHQVLTTVNC